MKKLKRIKIKNLYIYKSKIYIYFIQKIFFNFYFMNRTTIITSYLKRINQHVEHTQYTKFCDNVITSLIYFVHLSIIIFFIYNFYLNFITLPSNTQWHQE